MNRRKFLGAQTTALIGAAVLATAAGSSASAQSDGVMIAIPIIGAEGASEESIVSELRKFIQFISQQPGFIDGTLLKPQFADTPFEYLDVTRWNAQSDWENLFKSEQFLRIVDQNKAFSIKAAEVMTPVTL